MTFTSAIKCDIEKFDGMINFDLWQTQVKDVLIQYGLHNTLKGITSDMEEEKWKELDKLLAKIFVGNLLTYIFVGKLSKNCFVCKLPTNSFDVVVS